MTPLPTLGGGIGVADDINNRGQVVGMVENTTPEPDCAVLLQLKPVLWEDSKVQEIPTFPGDTGGQAIAVNDLAQVIGLSGGCQFGPTPGLHSWLWQNGALTDLGNLGGTQSAPSDINNRGQVVGQSDLPGDTTHHAFLWQDGVMTDLGTLPGDFSTLPKGINDKGQVVGQSCDIDGNCRAFLWQNGAMIDLNTLVPGGGSTLFLFEAFAINSRGQFVAAGFDVNSGDCCAFLATPSNGEVGSESSTPTVRDRTGQSPMLALPENVRKLLRQRMGFGRFLGTPQKVALSGAAAISGPNATLSPTSLTFSTQAIGTTSAAKTVTLKNTGTTSLTISSIAITGTNAGNFAQTHTCGSSLAVGASCTISVRFKPTASGTRTAALSVSDNAAGSPQKVTLSGIGTTAKLSPTSLSFGVVAICPTGTLKPPKTVTLTNLSTTALSITGIAITGTNAGDFGQTDTCGSSLAAGASCTISVSFRTTVIGTRRAALSITDNAAGSPQKVALSGTGGACGLGYCLVNSSNALTGQCIGQLGGMCHAGYDPLHCPLGQQGDTPGVFQCQVGNFKVDASRSCTP